MKNILVPTDFSTAAIHATDYAALLCREISAKLILLNVYMLPIPLAEVPFVMTTAEEMQRNSEEGLRKEAGRIFDETGIEVEWLVRMGTTVDEIRELEKEKSIDLVVMGNRRAEGMSKLIGSTTNAVIKKFKKPVLVIPENARFSGISRITYAADFDFQINWECLEPLLALTRKFNARLSIVHIMKEGKKLTAEQNAGKSKLEAICGNLEHEFHIYNNDEFEDGLVRFLHAEKTDLLVVVAHQHSFLERLFGHHTSRDLSEKTHLPLLILQDKG